MLSRAQLDDAFRTEIPKFLAFAVTEHGFELTEVSGCRVVLHRSGLDLVVEMAPYSFEIDLTIQYQVEGRMTWVWASQVSNAVGAQIGTLQASTPERLQVVGPLLAEQVRPFSLAASRDLAGLILSIRNLARGGSAARDDAAAGGGGG